MEIKNYIFNVPEYKYFISTVHPILELYRYQLIINFIEDLTKKINETLVNLPVNSAKLIPLPKFLLANNLGQGETNHYIKKNRVHRYFSQLLMSILTDLTYDKDPVILDDGLLNNCDLKQTEQFYLDLNYYLDPGSNKKVFTNDEFDIVNSIKKIIKSIYDFVPKISSSDSVYRLVNNFYQLDTEILKKYGPAELTRSSPADSPQGGMIDILNTISKHLQIPENVYRRVKKIYTGPSTQIDDYIFCCLVRYISLGSGANQYVVDLIYKKNLRKKFGVNFECFASVFNHYYDHYCSMFYDIEKYFGSHGSFMALKITQGFYMANPPYDNNLLHKMYLRVKKALHSNKSVAFIMSIPKWENYDLENQIGSEKLYHAKKIKTEYFLDPMTNKKVLIPPYISYIFANERYSIDNKLLLNQLTHYFHTFSNVKVPGSTFRQQKGKVDSSLNMQRIRGRQNPEENNKHQTINLFYKNKYIKYKKKYFALKYDS
jgi:hypothetical protein